MNPASFVTDKLLADSCERSLLLQYLISLQAEFQHVPQTAIDALSKALTVPASEITAVIDFYSFLYTTPRKFDILFSDNITDRMLGSQELMRQLLERLALTPGVVREDLQVAVDATSCTGMCEQGPAMLVNGVAITKLDKHRLEEIAELVDSDTPLDQWPAEFFAVDDNIQRKDILLSSIQSHTSYRDNLQQLCNNDAQTILDTLQAVQLRGRGGAGFMTAIKWRACRDTETSQRYVVCNADEGEPGTFKDRVLLQSYAHQLVEGMTLCAHTINAGKGFIYLRGEYRYLLEPLEAILEERRQQNLLGNNIVGITDFDFDIDIHLGAGAYICGEESALIESLEGKRGIPRKRPPFPVTEGYLSQPTVVNNVETFIAAAHIMLNGSDWFSSVGTAESTGTKLLSICGDCERPGIYEYPFGTPIRQILDDCGAPDVQAVQVAGAAGLTIPSGQFDRTIAFEDLATAGSFMIMGEHRNLLDLVQNFAHFFVHESCGFCTPCRVGGSLLKDLVDKAHSGHASTYDLDEMRRIASIMKETSFCGLGTTACNPVIETLNNFPDVYAKQITQSDYEPAFDLDASLEQARQLAHRDDPDSHIKADNH